MEFENHRCSRYYHGAAADVKSVLLGKTARYAPDRSFDSLHIRLDLAVDFDKRLVSGTCTTTVRAFKELSELSFNACAMRILSARLISPKPQKLRFRHDGERLTLLLAKPLKPRQECAVEVRYRVSKPRTGLHFVVPGPQNRNNPTQLWSQGQPEDSRYWFPCHDAPHEKVTSEVVAIVPKGFVAVSNGLLVEKRSGPETETFHWRMKHPHSVYLISLAVGRFAEIHDRWDNVAISYYCEKGREEDARRGFAKTPKILEYFSKSLGVHYPYERYAQVAVAEFPGGMENTTCTTQTDACLIDKRAALDIDLDALVAHELAHQWFGDLVTCKDWPHAWLNEGFATYFENLFTRFDKGDDEADYELYQNQQSYFYEDENRYRRPIVCDTYKYPWVLFDRHLYEKACWVLHMLRYTLTDSVWWKALHHYLTRFKDRSVETADLLAAIEESSGRNLKPFFDQWIGKTGYPSLRVHYRWDRAKKSAELRVLQTQNSGGETPLFKLAAEFRFTGPRKRWVKEFTETLEGKEHTFHFKLPGEPAMAEFDPRHWLLKKLDVRKPMALWLEELKSAQAAQSRIQAAKALARWGDARAAEALESAVRTEKFWGAAAEMTQALGSIKTRAALAALQRLTKLAHPKVRRAAVQALAEFREPKAAGIFQRLMRNDPSLQVQAEASRALGSLRERRWIKALASRLRERSYWDLIPGGAIQALANTRDPSVLELLRRASHPPFTYPARAYALRALSQFFPQSELVLDWLAEHAESPDERLSRTAIQCLGDLQDARALPALERIAKSHLDSRVKTYCEESIARIRVDSESAADGKASKKKKS